MAEKDMNIYFTGVAVDGDPQANPNGSLGGNRSGTIVKSLSASAIVNITGVVIDDVSATSGHGTATLTFDSTLTTLAYTAPLGTAGTAVDVSVNGTYEIYSADATKYIIVTVTSASLPATNQSDSITLTSLTQNLFDSVGSAEAQAGSVEYRAVIIKNDSAFAMNAMLVWIDTNTPFVDDSVQIAIEAPVAGAIQSVANETISPTGVVFSLAVNEASALSIGNLVAGSSYGVWIKRTVNPTSSRFANNSFSITVKADTV